MLKVNHSHNQVMELWRNLTYITSHGPHFSVIKTQRGDSENGNWKVGRERVREL